MKHAFVMQLRPGFETEYQRRHDDIWPELVQLLKRYGIADYAIYLEPVSLKLFGVFRAPHDFDNDELKQEPVMQRWWESMSPLMETLPNSHEPQADALLPVFFLE